MIAVARLPLGGRFAPLTASLRTCVGFSLALCLVLTPSLSAQNAPLPTKRPAAASTPAAIPPPPAPAAQPPAQASQPAKPQATAEPQVQVTTAKLDQVSQIIGNKVVEEFFALLRQNQIDQAYEKLTAGTVIAEKPDEVASLKSKTREAVTVFGAVAGHELIAAQSVGTRLMSATYVSLGKTFPLRWRFYFYRPEKTWRLIDIRVDDRLEDMFDEKSAPVPAAPR